MEARLEEVNHKYTCETCQIGFTAECKANVQRVQSVKEMYTSLSVCEENKSRNNAAAFPVVGEQPGQTPWCPHLHCGYRFPNVNMLGPTLVLVLVFSVDIVLTVSGWVFL